MTPIVRRVAPSDAADYRTIRLCALRTDPDAFGTTLAVEAARPLAEHEARLASSMVFGAYASGRIVGMAGLRRQDGLKDAHKGDVWGFFVEPAARGRGVGAALMTAVIEAAQGVVEQLMLSVVAGNAAAMALYERCGFVAYGVEPRALKTDRGYTDEVLMALLLPLVEATRDAADVSGRGGQ